MNIDELTQAIGSDSVIDQAALDSEALKIPLLHAKYYKIFMEEVRSLRILDLRYKELKRDRTDYYLGKAPDAVYQEEPLDHKVLKADLDLYLDSDKALSIVQTKRDLQKSKVQMIEDFIKTINNRSFLISNAISWRKFQNGVT